MRQQSTSLWGRLSVALTVCLYLTTPSWAAPQTEIQNVYAWPSPDGNTFNLIMTITPPADGSARFSENAYYVFHLSSRAKYGDPPIPINIVCKFNAAQRVQCWAAGDYATGNADLPQGLSSQKSQFRVFAGLREDPFFFNLAGFDAFRAKLKGALGSGQVTGNDADGCPAVIPDRVNLLSQLKEQPNQPGSKPSNAFTKKNVLALIVAIETAKVSLGAPIIGVWAATHQLQ